MKWSEANPGSAQHATGANAEIIANLWYVMDEQGFIYSLRVMTYVGTGTDDEKLSFLAGRAYLDYMVARTYPIPVRFGANFVQFDGTKTRVAVIHHDSAWAVGGIDQLFFDALESIAAEFPAQTELSIPESPLIKITAPLGVADGSVRPVDALDRAI